jgi:fumarate reductase flavoprotein subunit
MVEKSCDIIVLGGGGSGMVAAVRAAQLSGKRVIVLEKSKTIGGGALFASTTRTFQSKWQKERGIEDRTDAFLRKVMDLTYWKIDPELAGNCICGTGAFFDWFCEQVPEAVPLFHPGRYVFDGPEDQEGPVYGMQNNGTGRLVMEKMLEKCAHYGVEVLTKTPAVDVVVENGKITAVIADHEGEKISIACNACILASGSWIKNEKVVERVFPAFNQAEMDNSPHANPNYTGDGIAFAEKVGAFVDYDSFCIRIMASRFNSKSEVMNTAARSEYAINVNLNGKRFACEPLTSHMDDLFDTGHVLIQQPKALSFAIFDENTLAAAVKHSKEAGAIPSGPIPPQTFPDQAKTLYADIEKGIAAKNGQAFRADTLEELGRQMGVDEKSFVDTALRYNRYCEEGFDWDCFRPKQYLVPLNQPPFYGVKGTLMTDGAFGGVEVNAAMQAKSTDGGLVDGLYVTGDFASGRHINMDGVKLQILNDISWAFSSGFIAGTNAANELVGQVK